VLARTVEDAALLAEVLFGHDDRDKATELAPFPRLLATVQSKVPVPPTFAFVRTPFWDRADAQTRGAFEELSGLLGDQCFEAAMPNAFAEAAGIREQIHFSEMAKCYYSYIRRGAAQLSPAIMSAIETGNATPVRDYIAALDWPDILNGALDAIFQRCDAILTPAAPGPAPATLEATGDPIFNGLWTLCRTPTVTIPILHAENGMPMGVQLVGRRNDDGRLLRTAKWLADFAAMKA
jgi:aspartyl-tRNA(Asn)/glutamyl-tRNA(Gln) amidotransferase subunit A